MRKLPILCALLIYSVAVSLLACTKELHKTTIEIECANGSTTTLIAELARTETEKAHGYMGRKSIPQGTGMLFIYDKDQIMRFWMKDTPTPLSIAFIDSDGIIRDIFDMAPYSMADTTSTGYVRYALEVPQGWFSNVGVTIGDRVKGEF